MVTSLDDALTQLRELVTPSIPPALTDQELLTALDASLLPDEDGVWPGRDGYQPSYDVLWAAAETCLTRATKQALEGTRTLTRFSSEGSTFEVAETSPDWGKLAQTWRARSQIGQAIGYGTALGVEPVNITSSDYVPTSRAIIDGQELS